MTVKNDRIVAVLQTVWPDVETGDPVALAGGFWASMFRVTLAGQPSGVGDEIVVRFAPHREMGAKEAEVQRAAADQGFPTPVIHASHPDEETGGWWSVMEFSPGAPLLADLDGPAALRRAPSLARSLPVQLAEVMSSLHRLDPAPIESAVRAVAPDVALSTDDLVDQLLAGASAVDRSDVGRALERLRTSRPGEGRSVVCHGDLHPFNVLASTSGAVVLDWTGALVADPCFDVAYTQVLLANPPLVLPGALAPIGRAVGRLLSRRFVRAYERANPDVSLDGLDWFRSLHCARILIDLATMRSEESSADHPWVLLAPAVAQELSSFSGVEVGP